MRIRNRRLGAALLIALFMIVVLGGLAVLWLSGLRSLHRVDSAGQAQRRVTALEGFAFDETLGSLRETAREGALATDPPGPPFLPKAPANARLPRLLPDGLLNDPALRNLLQVSRGSVALDAGKRHLPPPDLGAPQLHFAGNGPSAGQVAWLYLGRDGPLTEAQARAKPSDIIGRYAFTLWDLGGCLDLNHAAHPEIPAAGPVAKEQLAAWLSRRGTLRALEPEGLPGFERGLANLLAWREPVSDPVNGAFGTSAPPTASNLETYRRFAGQFLPAVGGRETLEGAQRFLSRKDFLAVRKQLAPGLETAEAAEYTIFSRGLSEPAARPDRQGQPNASLAGSPVMSERALTTGGVLPPKTPALARRFALERLSLLGYSFPERASDDLARQREIRRWFGLWRATSAEAWSYLGSRADGTVAGSTELATLAQIAEESPGREPNFFETLKAAILSGSLGQNLPGAAAQGSAELQKNTDLHVLQIGLNLIDQWDADSFPTVLEVSPPGWKGAPIRVAGIENLPYLSQLHLDALNPFWWRVEPVPYEDRRLIPYLIPELWMPHQAALAVPPTSPRWNSTSDPAAGPRAVRLRLEGTVRLDILGKLTTQEAARPKIVTRYNIGSGVLVIGSGEFAGYGPVPRPVLTAEARDGCWDNGEFTYHGQQLGEPSNDGRLPNTSFYAARLAPDPRGKELLTAAFNARPLNANYMGLPKETAAGYVYDATGQPYGSMTQKGANPNKVWAFNTAETPCLSVELGIDGSPPETFDVVMDYLDHTGSWVPYTSFAAGSPNQAATHGLGNFPHLPADPKSPVLVNLFSGRMLSATQYTPDERRRYLDSSGAVTFFKGDPRTARLGVAMATSHVSADPYLTGLGGLPARSPMRWPGVLDIDAGRWGDGPVDDANAVSTPNAFSVGAGGFFGRGLENRFADYVLGGTTTSMKFTKFPPPDRLARPVLGLQKYADFFPGLFGENIDFGDVRESYYLDPDARVRPGDGWLWRHAVDRAHGVGPGQAGDEKWLLERSANQLYTNQSTFPRILNRPFQSVAEMGNAFRDLPQRSLDFTSPLSPDAALLDAFCLRETPVDARGRSLMEGVVNPGQMTSAALESSLQGVAQAEPQCAYSFAASPYFDQRESNLRQGRSPQLPTAGQGEVMANLPMVPLDKTSAGSLAEAFESLSNPDSSAESIVDLVAALADDDQNPVTPPNTAKRPQLGPVKADAFGVRRVSGADSFPVLGAGESLPFSAVKSEREAPLRALADVAEFRVWNLFLDLVVESGQVPRGATPAAALEEFAPQARRRAWYHLAIDRVTGQVLDAQRERAEF